MSNHMKPCVTVDVAWVLNHLDDPQVRLVEVDWDIETYINSHAPGAVSWTWSRENVRPSGGHISDKFSFAALMSQSGIDNQMTVALYGERDNLWAGFAARLLMAYGHADVRLIEGGGKQWLSDHKLASAKKPLLTPKRYDAQEPIWATAPQQMWYTTLCQLGPPDVTPSRSKPIVRPSSTQEQSERVQSTKNVHEIKGQGYSVSWDQPVVYNGAAGLTVAVGAGLVAFLLLKVGSDWFGR